MATAPTTLVLDNCPRLYTSLPRSVPMAYSLYSVLNDSDKIGMEMISRIKGIPSIVAYEVMVGEELLRARLAENTR